MQRCDASAAGDESLTDLVLDTNIASGKFASEIREALKDKLITENEMRAIGAAGLIEQQVMMTLIARLRESTGRQLHVVERSA